MPEAAEFRVVAREVWWPPRREVGDGTLTWCPRVEVGLARTGDRWAVLWKTPSMSAVAHTVYPCLLAAWSSYRRHREVLRAVSRQGSRVDRLAELDLRIAALQRERDQLRRLIDEGAA